MMITKFILAIAFIASSWGASNTFTPTIMPTHLPTVGPTTVPTIMPTVAPSHPTAQPTFHPTFIHPTPTPTVVPTVEPTVSPTLIPSARPTHVPTAIPTTAPTYLPTPWPTQHPTYMPTFIPTAIPTIMPTYVPTKTPTYQPTFIPTVTPTIVPTLIPTPKPSVRPTSQPSQQPSSQPSRQPISSPSTQPSRRPSRQPTGQPSRQPSSQPSRKPSRQPSSQPTRQPTQQPTRQPTGQPSVVPSARPTEQPTSSPSTQPTAQPSRQPSGQPTRQPTSQPTRQPTTQPTKQPTSQPSSRPSMPSGQPTARPSERPSHQPTGSPSPKPSVFTRYNHTQRYESLDAATFETYTSKWLQTHESWTTLRSGCPFEDSEVVYPACQHGFIVTGSGGSYGINNISCADVLCRPPPVSNPMNSNITTCYETPWDTVDYIAAPSSSSVDSSTICDYRELETPVMPPYYGLDEGIPPQYLPVTAVRLEIFGTVRGVLSDTQCSIIPNAQIIATQIDATQLRNYTFKSEHLDLFPSHLTSALPKHPNSASVTPGYPQELRDITCSGLAHSSDGLGSFGFNTSMPPSYGPPRHIMFTVSAPGFETLVTRLYFDMDWRLQQLTTLGGEVQSRDDGSMLAHGFTVDHTPNSTILFPGSIARDPRVAKLRFVPAPVQLHNIAGTVTGHFEANIDIILNNLRPSDSIQQQTSALPVAMDLNGLWSDEQGGMIMIETRGNMFWAREYPHGRSWATASGVLDGDTLRSADFKSQRYAVNSNIANNVAGTKIWGMGLSSGVVNTADSFNTDIVTQATSAVMSIVWSGGGYTSKWSKQHIPSTTYGYRYLKLVITRETGGFPGGVLAINEIKFYEGILSQKEMPSVDFKMKTPRYPQPQMVTCSTYRDQEAHCFRAFDGDVSPNSAWITTPVGSSSNVLSAPQWILIDFGSGRGCLPSAMLIVCDSSDTANPKGCPKTFALYGSNDNMKYNVITKTDMYHYNNDYANGGKLFHFAWESPTGRADGHKCGSCDLGPKFACNLMAYDGSCDSNYCTGNGVCGHPTACRLGEYMDFSNTGLNEPPYTCRQCPPGRYGNETGLTSPYCSGICEAGFYCPSGSTSAQQVLCGGSNVFCPPNSGQPIAAGAGRRTVPSLSNQVYPLSTSNPFPSTMMTAEVLCDQGHYCVKGLQFPCPAGRFGNRRGLASRDCVDECIAGEYCPLGSVNATVCEKGYYCPDGVTRVICPAGLFGAAMGLRDSRCSGLCKAGYYCNSGSLSSTAQLCPAGRFGLTQGMQDSSCSGPCHAGYWCVAGSTNSTAQVCGEESVYCPEGSPSPVQVSEGYYSIGGGPLTRQGQSLCEAGFYCADGMKYSCPLGTFGSSSGMTNIVPEYQYTIVNEDLPTGQPTSEPSRQPTSQPTRQPTGQPTVRPSQHVKRPTGQPTSMPTEQLNSPAPSSTPTAGPTSQPTMTFAYTCSGFCAPGYYCTLNSTSQYQNPCPPGRYGSTSGLADASCTAACPMGHWCAAGTVVPTPCPAGVFGNVTGLVSSSCTDQCWEGGCLDNANACREGYYCPKGSVTDTQLQCGGTSFYCPRGSAWPTVVSTGYYTVGPSSFTQVSQSICEIGNFCVNGIKSPCPSGSYGDSPGLSSSSCSGLCQPGYYCPMGSSNGTTFRCPAGRYGATAGLYASACTGECAAGYYCPEASVTPTPLQCAQIALIPPDVLTSLLGPMYRVITANTNINMLPLDSSPGIAPLPSQLYQLIFDRFHIFGIPSGYIDGLRQDPDISNYGIVFGTNSSMSAIVLQNPNSVFCPVGSAMPLVVLPGYYSTGSNKTTRYEQYPCPPGTWCSLGVIHDCPAGTYGRASRLTSSNCTGLCQKGFYCPPASTSRNQFPCPLGRYGAVAGLPDSGCSGACVQPLNCPLGSVRDFQLTTAQGSDIW